MLSCAIVEPDLVACEAGDISAITPIYRHAVLQGRASFEIDPPDEDEMAARRERLVLAGYPYIVAFVEDEIAGYAYAGAYRLRPAYGGTVENSVYVKEGFQGQGVGRALLARLIVEAEARGFRQMMAVIGDSTNYASVRLHQRLDFLVGTLRSVGWKHEHWLNT